MAISAFDTFPAVTSVSFDWSSDRRTWHLIADDVNPADGFGALWGSAAASGRVSLRARDSDGNRAEVQVTVDNALPALSLHVGPLAFSPNLDGRRDRAEIRVFADEPVRLTLQLLGPRGLVVRTEARELPVAARRTRRFLWDGAIYNGLRRGRDGLYTARATAVDRAGNRVTTRALVRVDTRPPLIRGLEVSPQEPERGPVTVRFRLVDAAEGVVVRPKLFDASGNFLVALRARAVARGPISFALPLRGPRGASLPPGSYRVGIGAVDRAGNGLDATAHQAPFLFSRVVRARVWGRFRGVGRRIALTFDDCYDSAGWAGVLDALARADVQATFFCSGTTVAAYPALALRTVREGHAIGSHGWDHANFAALSYGSALRRLLDDRNVWWRLARVAPTPFFRPPYATYTSNTLAAAGAAGYAAVVLWDVDPLDWLNPGTSTVVQRVVGATRPGSIVLLHTLPQTAAALPAIVAELRARGYGLLSVPQLALLGTPTPGHWLSY